MSRVNDRPVNDNNVMPSKEMSVGKIAKLITAATAPVIGTAVKLKENKKSIAVTASNTATCDIEVSNDGVNFVKAGTIDLLAAGSDGFVINAPWLYIRANLTAVVGTVDVTVGY